VHDQVPLFQQVAEVLLERVPGSAAALQVSRPALSSLLNGKADLSGDMALRIEKAFGVMHQGPVRRHNQRVGA
jgi:plasmid maintenance system antidote protein VapI